VFYASPLQANRVFCSNACRGANHYHRRKQARALLERVAVRRGIDPQTAAARLERASMGAISRKLNEMGYSWSRENNAWVAVRG